jgi:hypothetical protein
VFEKVLAANTPEIYGQFTMTTRTAYTNEKVCIHITSTLRAPHSKTSNPSGGCCRFQAVGIMLCYFPQNNYIIKNCIFSEYLLLYTISGPYIKWHYVIYTSEAHVSIKLLPTAKN